MRSIFAFFLLLFLLPSLCAGAPVRSGKGKGKAKAKPPPPNEIPLPGRTGVYADHATGVATLFYGDDDMPEHMGHVQRNHKEFPGNMRPMTLSADKGEIDQNRDEALKGVDFGGYWRNNLDTAVRDEKHLAMFYNPDHAHATTVEMVPSIESYKEGTWARKLKAAINDNKLITSGQIRANPGWKELDPHQRVGHEAPAGYHPDWRGPPPTGKKSPEFVEVLNPKIRKAPKPGSNFRPGRVSPPGHVWRPNKVGGPHFGAPTFLKGSETRHPPRPKDRAHYELQQKQAAEAHAAHEQAQKSAEQRWNRIQKEVQTTKALTGEEKSRYHANLAKFNAAHPIGPIAHGVRPAEAPGRLEHKNDHQSATHGPHHGSAPQVVPSHQHVAPPPHAAAASSSSRTFHSTNTQGTKRMGNHISSGGGQKRGRHMH